MLLDLIKDKENPINLRWKPKTSENMNLFVAVEPNSWQNVELPKEEEEDLTGDTMTCFLGTKYRNCNAIDGFVGDHFENFEAFFDSFLKMSKRSVIGGMGMKGHEIKRGLIKGLFSFSSIHFLMQTIFALKSESRSTGKSRQSRHGQKIRTFLPREKRSPKNHRDF